MKKILVLVLALLLLTITGCSNSKEDILYSLEGGLSVCEDGCLTDSDGYDAFYKRIIDYKDVHLENLISYEDQDSTYISDVGTTYDREDISIIDPVNDNWEIPIFTIYDTFISIMTNTFFTIDLCTVGEGCDVPFTYSFGESNSDVDFGYNDNEGFYRFTILNDDDSINYIEEAKYYADSERLEFERSRYYVSEDRYYYEIFYDNEYRYYGLKDGTDITFKYMNVDTTDYLEISTMGPLGFYNMYNPETGFWYSKGSTYNEVAKYDGFEFVSSLEELQNEFTISFSFYELDDWDTFKYLGRVEDPFVTSGELYNDGERVYSEFDIEIYKQGLEYNKIYTSVVIEESDLNTYTFLEGFDDETTVKDLIEEYNLLIDEETNYILDLYGITLDMVEDNVFAVLNELETEYGYNLVERG